jgi:hypothetical protein
LIHDKGPNVSAYAFQLNIIRELLRERECRVVKIYRDSNKVSHELAKLGRVHGHTELWLGDFPLEITKVLADVCNPVIV